MPGMKHVHGVARALSNGDVSVEVGDYQPKSILLTGGAGFIASHVVIRLVQNYPDTKVGLPVSAALPWAVVRWGLVKAGLAPVKRGCTARPRHPVVGGIRGAVVQGAALPRGAIGTYPAHLKLLPCTSGGGPGQAGLLRLPAQPGLRQRLPQLQGGTYLAVQCAALLKTSYFHQEAVKSLNLAPAARRLKSLLLFRSSSRATSRARTWSASS